MAVKKSELYSSLWASCDSLRGGMDSSQYKDYILTLLFVKYVSDKFKGIAYGDIDVPEGGSFDDMLELIGNKNIGEEMDKIIARLAEANNLRGVIDNAHFNDEDKLGRGKEMVDKLSELLGIFRDQMPDFSKNRADERDGIIMIDASRDFIKDGNKNRLRERDIYKITTVFNMLVANHNAKTDQKYVRLVPLIEIKEKNAYNLNIPRYIDSGVSEDIQSIYGHLNGGIPTDDVGSLSLYWETFPNLQSTLFAPLRKDFYSLAVEKGAIRDTIYGEHDFSAYADKVENAFESWMKKADGKLRTISNTTKPKLLITEIAEEIIAEYAPVTLVDKYDAYEVLMSYWNETMSDDVYLIVQDGYKAGCDIEVFKKITSKKKKDSTEIKQEKETGWDGKLVPKALIIEMFFAAEQKAIDGRGICR